MCVFKCSKYFLWQYLTSYVLLLQVMLGGAGSPGGDDLLTVTVVRDEHGYGMKVSGMTLLLITIAITCLWELYGTLFRSGKFKSFLLG